MSEKGTVEDIQSGKGLKPLEQKPIVKPCGVTVRHNDLVPTGVRKDVFSHQKEE